MHNVDEQTSLATSQKRKNGVVSNEEKAEKKRRPTSKSRGKKAVTMVDEPDNLRGEHVPQDASDFIKSEQEWEHMFA